MSPVLIDQRRLPIIIIGMLNALIITFCGGYFLGARTAETSLPQAVARLELNLPAASLTEVSQEAIAPELNTPGASIDVDSVDSPPATDQPSVANKLVQSAVVEPSKPDSTPAPATTPAPADSTAEAVAKAADLAPAAIADDAEQDTARYSIQVGIYGSLTNAETQVASLQAQALSAYYESYQNQKDETRYRVRFGYFASHTSASRALELWQLDPAASSGYLVRITR